MDKDKTLFKKPNRQQLAIGCSLPTSDITCVQSWHSLYKSSLLIPFYKLSELPREAQTRSKVTQQGMTKPA